jgi:hypothetical protein
VNMRLNMAICTFFNGHARMDALGMNRHVHMLPGVVIYTY